MRLLSLICLLYSVSGFAFAGEANTGSSGELDKSIKSFVQYLDSLRRAPVFAPAKSPEREKQFKNVADMEDKIWDNLVKMDDAGIAKLDKAAESLLQRNVNYESPVQCFWSMVSQVCFNRNWSTAAKNALLKKYLASNNVPVQVKAWLVSGAGKTPSAAASIPEDVLLNTCMTLMSVKTPVLFVETWSGGSEQEVLYDAEGKVSGVKNISANKKYSLLMTGRDLATELIQDLYKPEEVKWPGPSMGNDPETQIRREEAAKAAEKWIEKQITQSRLQSGLLSSLENHRTSDLNTPAKIDEAFSTFVANTGKNRQDIVERLMKLLLTETAMAEKDHYFIESLARTIKQVCEKNNSVINPASSEDLKNADACRKWLGTVIISAKDKPMNYFEKRDWEQIAENLGILIENPK